MTSESVLVTGGAGFIGSHVVEELVRRGFNVTVLTHYQGSPANLRGVTRKINLKVGDISKTNWISKVPAARTVVHLACHQRSFSFARPQTDVSVNVIGTVNVLEYARKYDARIIFSSNSGIYGPCVLAKEDDPVNCLTPYDVGKYSGELMMRAYNNQYGIESTIFRLATIYGPGQRINERQGWMPVIATFAKNLLQGRRITIYGDGLQTRDLVYVKDAAEGLLKAMHSKRKFDVFNLSSAKEVKIIEILQMVSDCVGSRIQPVYAPARPGELRRMSYSNGKIKRDLGWEPKTPLKVGIQLTVDSIRKPLHRLIED